MSTKKKTMKEKLKTFFNEVFKYIAIILASIGGIFLINILKNKDEKDKPGSENYHAPSHSNVHAEIIDNSENIKFYNEHKKTHDKLKAKWKKIKNKMKIIIVVGIIFVSANAVFGNTNSLENKSKNELIQIIAEQSNLIEELFIENEELLSKASNFAYSEPEIDNINNDGSIDVSIESNKYKLIFLPADYVHTEFGYHNKIKSSTNYSYNIFLSADRNIIKYNNFYLGMGVKLEYPLLFETSVNGLFKIKKFGIVGEATLNSDSEFESTIKLQYDW